MECIERNNSLETAKNRLYISGLTYVTSIEGTTKYVHDRCVVSNTDDVVKQYLPLVVSSGNSDEYILRYKNLVRQYYWLANKFIPSCSLQRLCMRNSKKTWITYNDPTKTEENFREHIVNYYYNINIISTSTVIEGEKARNFVPNKVGYTFNGWLYRGNFFDFNTPITSNIGLQAVYTRQSFTIIFHLNNGEDDTVMTVYYGDTPIIPDPTKDGSEFMGWNPLLAPATADTVYNATYSTDAYTIIFYDIRRPDDLLDGDNYEHQPIENGDTTKYKSKETEQVEYDEASEYYKTVPTYQHFDFDGWLKSDGSQITNGEFEHVHGGLQAYPKLKKKVYTVNFYAWDDVTKDDMLINTQNVEYMGDAEPPTPTTKPNYEFIGWSAPYTGITYNASIFAQYSGDELNYTYLLPNATGTGYETYRSGTTHYNSTIPTVPSPTISEYDPFVYGLFDGWYTDAQYQNKWNSTSLITVDTTIYGKWKNEFEVTFYNHDNTKITGLTEAIENPVYVTYGGDVPQNKLDIIEANVELPPGYFFVAWDSLTTDITRDTKITAIISTLQT